MSAEKPLRAWDCRYEDRHCDDDECRCPPPPEKPLHVQVAEALGWTGCHSVQIGDTVWWGSAVPGWTSGVPRYDTDWSATGPLIEQHGLALIQDDDGAWWCYTQPYGYIASHTIDVQASGGSRGATPLQAACACILALKAAGKLDKQ